MYHYRGPVSILKLILVTVLLTGKSCQGTGVQEQRDPDTFNGDKDDPGGSECYVCNHNTDPNCIMKDPSSTEKCKSGCLLFKLESSEGVIGKAGKMCKSGNELLIHCAKEFTKIPFVKGKCYKAKISTDKQFIKKLSDSMSTGDDCSLDTQKAGETSDADKTTIELLLCTCRGARCNAVDKQDVNKAEEVGGSRSGEGEAKATSKKNSAFVLRPSTLQQTLLHFWILSNSVLFMLTSL